MIDRDRLLELLRAEHPFVELDRAVRAELSAGGLKRTIRAELIALEDSVRDILDENEFAEEALRDVIDALAGYCPLKYAYADADDRSPSGTSIASFETSANQAPLQLPKP